VTSLKRLKDLPDVPPIADTLRGYELLGWAGFMPPARTPKEISDVFYKAAVAVLSRADVNKRLDDLGYVAVGNRPEEMAAYIKSEIEKYAKIVRQIDLPRE
jgi:tripartite-type tricarboxylate transporter receptor subunit TctC